jgi:hypothetical protein
VDETPADERPDDQYGEAAAREAGLIRDDFPDLDEALDPELDPEFDVPADLELEKRDIHEADDALAGGDEGAAS